MQPVPPTLPKALWPSVSYLPITWPSSPPKKPSNLKCVISWWCDHDGLCGQTSKATDSLPMSLQCLASQRPGLQVPECHVASSTSCHHGGVAICKSVDQIRAADWAQHSVKMQKVWIKLELLTEQNIPSKCKSVDQIRAADWAEHSVQMQKGRSNQSCGLSGTFHPKLRAAGQLKIWSLRITILAPPSSSSNLIGTTLFIPQGAISLRQSQEQNGKTKAN